MRGSAIQSVRAAMALDSRGTPTVTSEVELASGARARATAPAGASTGSHEVAELRDGGDRFGGRGVARAVHTVRTNLAEAVHGIDALDQQAVDTALRTCDGTATLGRLGGNAILSVSLATALAAARHCRQPAYCYLGGGQAPLLPLPMINLFSGGAHAAQALDIQDVLVVPVGSASFAEAIAWVWEIRTWLLAELTAHGHPARLVADEGGFGVPLRSNRHALDLVTEAISAVGLSPGEQVGIALDIAANELLGAGRYRLASENRALTGSELVEELRTWCADFPIVSIEDPLAEDDWDGWRLATDRLPGVQLLGDDLFATSTARLQRAIAEGTANAVLIKPNQCGTLSAANDVRKAAQESGYATVLSARSGETEESWLADLATAWRTGQVKVGSLTRSDRTAKWNRLLWIESEAGTAARYAGRSALAERPIHPVTTRHQHIEEEYPDADHQ